MIHFPKNATEAVEMEVAQKSKFVVKGGFKGKTEKWPVAFCDTMQEADVVQDSLVALGESYWWMNYQFSIKIPLRKDEVPAKFVRQKWIESERGWGQRPDGYTLHKDEEARVRFVEKYNEKYRSDAYAPDVYSYPASYGLMPTKNLTDQVIRDVMDSDGVWYT